MISSLTGKVAEIVIDGVEIEVGGVGYFVRVPASSLKRVQVGETIRILTEMVVREDSLSLYGFVTPTERNLFRALISVTGVGPKLALSVIGHLRPDSLRNAVASSDVATLTAVPGVGLRSAQRIVMELKQQLGDLDTPGTTTAHLTEVREVLLGLGYAPSEVAPVLDEVAGESSGVEAMVKMALRALSRA